MNFILSGTSLGSAFSLLFKNDPMFKQFSCVTQILCIFADINFIIFDIMNILVGLLLAFLFFVVLGALLDKSRNNNENSYNKHGYGKALSNEIDKIFAAEEKRRNGNLISIVGGFYRSWEAKRVIKKLYTCESVFLKEEPDNPYDHNAIMVLSKKGLHIGYVAKHDIQTVKDRMQNGPVKGSVYDIADSRYEYLIELQPMEEGDEEYNNAIYFFNKRKRIEVESRKKTELRKELGIDDIVVLAADDLLPKKKYSSILRLLKPVFNAGAQDGNCYELMIYCCHYMQDYELELKYIDKSIESGQFNDRAFLNRRKYQVLRLLGHLVSNDQIENEKAGVETTILELDFFNRIVSILSDVVDPNRIDFRDSKGLFAINLDNNIRRPICKLYLNNPDKMFIGLINEDGSLLKVRITDISELDELKDDLLRPINKFLDKPNFYAHGY